MTGLKAYTGCRIFDGVKMHRDAALVTDGRGVDGVVPASAIPADCAITRLEGGMIVPGFVDLQVNGGGGALFNNDPSVDAIRTICDAHARFGTTALLPTLITDTAETTSKAINAGIEATKAGVPGFAGLHLEGPHLSVERKGAHDAALIRKMTDGDLAMLVEARKSIPNLMVTVAPESVSDEQISALARAGIVVSLGHSNSTLSEANTAVNAGARCATHLFNAMSPLTHRQPGMVGAVLIRGELYAGLIADGFHVNPVAISLALAAKTGPGKIFLVSDSMSTIGTDVTTFELGGRQIFREGGRLTLCDGTLAGADITLSDAIRYLLSHKIVKSEVALQMATSYPADCMGIGSSYGHLRPGSVASFVLLGDDFAVKRVWREGQSLD